jgi:hypothetical protein
MEQKPIKTTSFLHADKPLNQQIKDVAAKDKSDVTSNPKINPAGKLKVKQSATEKITLGNGGYYRNVDVKTYPAPDPSHAARRRGQAARNSWDARAKGQ